MRLERDQSPCGANFHRRARPTQSARPIVATPRYPSHADIVVKRAE